MHWTVEKKLFGKSLNLEYLATRNVFFATEQVWNNTKLEYLATRNVFLLVSKSIPIWNVWQQEMFFAEQVLNNNKRDLN